MAAGQTDEGEGKVKHNLPSKYVVQFPAQLQRSEKDCLFGASIQRTNSLQILVEELSSGVVQGFRKSIEATFGQAGTFLVIGVLGEVF